MLSLGRVRQKRTVGTDVTQGCLLWNAEMALRGGRVCSATRNMDGPRERMGPETEHIRDTTVLLFLNCCKHTQCL